MTILTSSRRSPSQDCVSDLYRRALVWVGAAWLIATVVTVGVVMIQDADRSEDALFVAALSGAIAVVSMLPGLCLRWARVMAANWRRNHDAEVAVTDPAMDQFGDFVLASGMGMIFRLFGTVALFLFCRYQLAESKQWVAGFTLGWYAYLTTVEVGVLACMRNRVATRSRNGTSDTDVSLSTKTLPARASDDPLSLVDSSVIISSSLLRFSNSVALHAPSVGVLKS